MFLKPMQILKMIIIGSLMLWMINYTLSFYGLGGSWSWPYLMFYLFILLSTAILDLQVPSIEL